MAALIQAHLQEHSHAGALSCARPTAMATSALAPQATPTMKWVQATLALGATLQETSPLKQGAAAVPTAALLGRPGHAAHL
jgi:hypothetical protein